MSVFGTDAEEILFDPIGTNLISKDTQDAIVEVNSKVSAILTQKGTISIPSEFPTIASVLFGWTYKVLATVTDNDPTRTNTGQTFNANDVIYWNGVDWTDITGIETWNRVTGATNYVIPKNTSDDIGATAQRITKGWYTDLEITNMPTVNGISINSNGILDLTSAEIDQLKNIDSETISNTQWNYLGTMNQGIATSDSVQFAQITVDNLGLNGNTISSSSGDIILSPNSNNVTIGIGAAGIDYTLTFDGEDNDGVITWLEDEDTFDIACNLQITDGKLLTDTITEKTTDAGIDIEGLHYENDYINKSGSDSAGLIFDGSDLAKFTETLAIGDAVQSSAIDLYIENDSRQVLMILESATGDGGGEIIFKESVAIFSIASDFSGATDYLNFGSNTTPDIFKLSHDGNALFAGDVLLNSGDLGITGNRVIKGWFTDIESTNMPTVSGTNINANGVLDLTVAEVDQLEKIGTTIISVGQWVYLGAMNQGVATTDTPSFAQITVDNLVLNGNTISATGDCILNPSGNIGADVASPTSKFHFGGAFAGPFIALTNSALAATNAHYRIQMTNTTSNQGIVLPAANACTGRVYWGESKGSTWNIVFLEGASVRLTLTGDEAGYVYSDGTDWVGKKVA